MKTLKFIFLSQLTLLPHALGALLPRQDDIGVEWVNLQFSDDCQKSGRTGEIMKSWDDALRLLYTVPKIDFYDTAAIQFFGPPKRNRMFITLEYVPCSLYIRSISIQDSSRVRLCKNL